MPIDTSRGMVEGSKPLDTHSAGAVQLGGNDSRSDDCVPSGASTSLANVFAGDGEAAKSHFLFDVDFEFSKKAILERSSVPLFDHFIAVGATAESAGSLVNHLCTQDNETLSSRLRKTFGGLLNSPMLLGV